MPENITRHLDTTIAFETDSCTTLEDAKKLTAESACLQSFTSRERAAFLHAVDEADVTGVWVRIAAPSDALILKTLFRESHSSLLQSAIE
jgi:hypothetical protein